MLVEDEDDEEVEVDEVEDDVEVEDDLEVDLLDVSVRLGLGSGRLAALELLEEPPTFDIVYSPLFDLLIVTRSLWTLVDLKRYRRKVSVRLSKGCVLFVTTLTKSGSGEASADEQRTTGAFGTSRRWLGGLPRSTRERRVGPPRRAVLFPAF